MREDVNTKWPIARDFAAKEFPKLLEAEHIGRLREQNVITEEQAFLLMGMRRNASRSVPLTIEGLGLVAAQAAIDAALGAVRTAVNNGVGLRAFVGRRARHCTYRKWLAYPVLNF